MTWHLFRSPPPSRGVAADKALTEANSRVERIHDKDDEVKNLVDELRKKREADHFAAMIREAMRRI